MQKGFSNVNDGKDDNIGEQTRASKKSVLDEIYEEMFLYKNDVQKQRINKKILISGLNGTGKSSLALGLSTFDLKEDEMIIYVDIDNSGLEIVQEFYYDDFKNHKISVYNPNVFEVDEEGIAVVKNERKNVGYISTAAQAVRKGIENGYTVKAVIVDGISFLLDFCEAIMRIDKNKAVDEGIPIGAWKIRNDEFKKCISSYMSLPTVVFFISHEDFIYEEQENFASVKQNFINECSMRMVLDIRDGPTPNIDHYYARIRKNRSDILTVNREYLFMACNRETNNVQFSVEELYNIVFPQKEEEDIDDDGE